MSLTNAVRKRFWSAMGERFGKRWLDEYGEIPTLAWREMIDRYTPSDIGGALELMALKGWQHPPTQPQFEPLLREASRHNKPDEQDWRRGYWRSWIARYVAGDFLHRELISDMDAFEAYLIEHRHTLGKILLALLDELDSMERDTQQRTQGMEDLCMRRCREIGRGWRPPQVRETA